MANITHKWKRLMAVSCSHAKYVDKEAWDAVLKFKAAFKPTTTLHLGDFVDLTALMSNGAGSGHEGEEITPDVDTGLTHLRELRPNVIMAGNHEDRAWKLLGSKSPAVAYASHQIVQSIEKTCKDIKGRFIPYAGIEQIYDIADIGFTHGTCYGETAARDMAEQYCNGKRRRICFGHSHKVAIQSARTHHGGTGYNIGTLTKRGALEYAKTRRSTFGWTQGVLYGEYCEELNQSSLHIAHRSHGEVWRFPL
jgi:predicted phosphodiesterase